MEDVTMTEMNEARENEKLTGKAFVSLPSRSEQQTFQLEIILGGEVTRLQAPPGSKLPEKCLFDRRHDGLEVKSCIEILPLIYVVGCSCGYSVEMREVNEGFMPYKQ